MFLLLWMDSNHRLRRRGYLADILPIGRQSKGRNPQSDGPLTAVVV